MYKEAKLAFEEQEYAQENPQVDVVNRIRELEGKYNLLRDRVLIMNNNMIEEYKKIIGEIKVVDEDIRHIKTDIFNIKESIKHIINDLELFAKKDEVKYLEKYINLWNPMKFTTESDVRRILGEHKKEDLKKHARSE